MTLKELIEEYLKTCWVGLYGEADIDMNGVFTSVSDTREQLAYIVFDHDFEFLTLLNSNTQCMYPCKCKYPLRKSKSSFPHESCLASYPHTVHQNFIVCLRELSYCCRFFQLNTALVCL